MQAFVHDLCQRLIPAKVLVVEFRVPCWINPAEVLHSVELSDCVTNKITEAK